MKKQCSYCKKTKSLTAFHIQKAGKYGRTSRCKVCKNKLNKPYNDKLLKKKQNPNSKRLCISCNKKQPNKLFLFKGRICKPCRGFDLEPPKDRREYSRNWNRKKGLELKQYIFKYLETHPCSYPSCDVTDVMMLELDHKNPKEKSFEIGKAYFLQGMTLQLLKKELRKCQVLCSNHHQKKTHTENKSWRYLMATGKLPK